MRQSLLFACLMIASTAAKLQSCDSGDSGYFQMMSKTFGQVTVGKTLEFNGRCFKRISVVLTETSDQYVITATTEGHKELTCVEFLLFSTGKTSKPLFIVIAGVYHTEINKKTLTSGEDKFIRKSGLFVMRSCDDLKNLPKNVWGLLKMFVGGLGLNPYIPVFGSKIMEYQLKANIDFIHKFTGYEWKLRQNPKKVIVDRQHVKSGDFIAITRFDGIDNIIHMGSGSRVGHSTMALWHEGELWVVESQAANYWPKNNIQRTKYEEWIRWADNADFNVVIIPLKEEVRAKFDEKKAWEAFLKMEGHPYGFGNFLFGWIDLEHGNQPDVMDLPFISILLGLVEKIMPDQIKLFFYDALNLRLGTKGLNIGGIWEELYERDMTLNQLAAMVEKEEWEYPSGHQYVCSSFLVYLYKAAGLFGGLEVNATEFTPKDLYELNFWDLSGKQVPPNCKESAPRGYCQVMGKVDFDIGKMSFVEPYAHMAERCPTIAPNYERSEGC